MYPLRIGRGRDRRRHRLSWAPPAVFVGRVDPQASLVRHGRAARLSHQARGGRVSRTELSGPDRTAIKVEPLKVPEQPMDRESCKAHARSHGARRSCRPVGGSEPEG
jgi:hypothetical protein